MRESPRVSGPSSPMTSRSHAGQLRTCFADVAWIVIAGEDGRRSIHGQDRQRGSPDLLFLDIRMPEGDGLEVLHQLDHHPHVIFTTAFDRYAVAAFEVQASTTSSSRSAPSAWARRSTGCVADGGMRRRCPNDTRRRPGAASRCAASYVRVGGRIIPVARREDSALRSQGDYVALHTADGCYVVNTSVEYLAERLSPGSFVRIHRSRIVNLEAVQAFERHAISVCAARLTNGTTVVASRAWSSALRGEAT